MLHERPGIATAGPLDEGNESSRPTRDEVFSLSRGQMTDEKDPVEARFVALETKVAYQDKLIAELNEVVVARAREIDVIAKRLTTLERYLREPQDEPTPAQERPPHY